METKAPYSSHLSLEGIHNSVEVPHHQANFWERWRAFVGPAILVSVGYMDPGNWGTDLQGGARFKYGLLWVVGLHSHLMLLHVADGWAARTYGQDAVSPEIAEDTAYLERAPEFQSMGIPTDAELAYGEPANEIIKWVQHKGCDLVAMSTHGHRFLADICLGTTASRVQHNISVPVLLLRAK